jgi:uncharacterized protein (DUF2147 family)
LSFPLLKSLLGALAAATLMLAAAVVPSNAAPVALSSILGSPIEGSWRTLQGTEVTVAPCDEAYCGTLTWVVVPKQFTPICEQDKAAFALQMTDLNNPDPALKTRPILGMEILKLQPTGDPRTFNAHIYNSEDGKSYDGLVWVVNNDTTLRLGGGCLGSLCAVTQDWPRVPARLTTPDFTCRPE